MKNFSKKCGLAVLSTLVVSSLHAAVVPDTQKNSSWFNEGQAAIQKQLALTPKNRAKNVILFVGDGLGVSTITAGRIFAGQKLGISGEEHQLSFDRMPYSAQVKTYNTNQQTPDSAGTMTAMMAGVKNQSWSH